MYRNMYIPTTKTNRRLPYEMKGERFVNQVRILGCGSMNEELGTSEK